MKSLHVLIPILRQSYMIKLSDRYSIPLYFDQFYTFQSTNSLKMSTSDSKKSTEEDDVMEFLNSLPESSRHNGTSPINKSNSTKDEDILGFLDELAAQSKPSTPIPAESKPTEPKLTESKQKEPKAPAAETISKKQADEAVTSDTTDEEAEEQNENEIVINDPITSIANWWGKEGSTKVNSLWGSITSNYAAKATEYQNSSISSIDKLTKLIPDLNIDKIDRENLNLNQISATLNNVINSVINTDELITVNIIADFKLDYLSSIIEKNFKMAIRQVEGGIKLGVHNYSVVEDPKSQTKLNVFKGKFSDGEKLAFANLDSCIKEFKSNKSQVEKEFRESCLFITIQPINHVVSETKSEQDESGMMTIDGFNPNSFSFSIILKDVTHDFTTITRSQAFPLKWLEWLEDDSEQDEEGIDPKEWVKDWIKDGLSLSLGVLAQSYVIKRMGY